MKIYFDESLLDSFMDYAMIRRGEYRRKGRLLPYFELDEVRRIALYYAKTKKYYCNEKGAAFYEKELVCGETTEIFMPNGIVLKNKIDILKFLKDSLETDKEGYVEFHLYCRIWCDIERLLRCEYEGCLDADDKRLLNRARKYIKI